MGKILCHDCQTPIVIQGEEIKNGVRLGYKDVDELIKVFKCNDCYEKNPNLTNFRNCEVYSRIVGYLRPVSQWNQGKQQEYKEKKIFAQPADIQ